MNRLLKRKIVGFWVFGAVFWTAVLFSANSYAIEFVLVNASTDRDVRILHNNDVIDVQQVGAALNIRAEVEATVAHDSVRFILNGTDFRTEEDEPYALAGDNPTGNYLNWTPNTGNYTLIAIAENAAGGEVARSSIGFRVANSDPGGTGPVSGSDAGVTFTLIDAATDRDISAMVNNGVIDLSRVGNALNIRANVHTNAAISMVRFILNGVTFREERSAPYALAGDDPTGDYLTWSPAPGSYTLQAEAVGAGGAVAARGVVGFEVSGSGGTAAPVSGSDRDGITFTLVNAATDQDIYSIADNGVIDLSRVGNDLNIRAEVRSSASIAMVEFFLNGASFRQERSAPYALAGDDPTGDYLTWSPATGSYSLQAVASNDSQNIVAQSTVRFQVSGSSADTTTPGAGSTSGGFNGAADLISLHFDHCADPDDGHATVADRTIIGAEGIPLARVHVVSGTYGAQPYQYQSAAETVMTAAWGQSGWENAHSDWNRAVSRTVDAWSRILGAGGHVWIAEGGQSDFTAEVVRDLQSAFSANITRTRIHLVQHSDWNERYTTAQDLDFVRSETDYVRIADGNQTGNGTAGLLMQYSNNAGAIDSFMQSAEAHPTFGRMWTAAFNYLDPSIGYPRSNPNLNYRKLDFSDSVELLYILGVGTNRVSNCTTFANRFIGDVQTAVDPGQSNPGNEPDEPMAFYGDLGLPSNFEATARHDIADEMKSLRPNAELPAVFDWRDRGMVTRADNQEGCGSCYAFTTIGAIESKILINGGPMYDLSELQILNCDGSNEYCEGGSMTAILFFSSTQPMNEACTGYNYNGMYASSPLTMCSHLDDCAPVPYCIRNYHTIAYNVENLKWSVFIDGPAYFRFDTYDDFQPFWHNSPSGGVYRNVSDNSISGDDVGGHAVLLIGWDDTRQAWLCKNSWGATEGPDGDGTFWIRYADHRQNLNFGAANFNVVHCSTPTDPTNTPIPKMP